MKSFFFASALIAAAGCAVSAAPLDPADGVTPAGSVTPAPTASLPAASPPKDPKPDPEPEPKDDKDAGSDASPPPPPPPPPPNVRRIFVTKQRFRGDLKTAGGGANGPDGADRICAAAATAANLGGTNGWKAWISATGQNAIDRIVDLGPWYLVDKTTLVFANKAQLANLPSNVIHKNETGTVTSIGQNLVWTGTRVGGTLDGPQCNDWTSNTSGSATIGSYEEKDHNWTRNPFGKRTCTSELSLYCIEQ